MQAPTLFVLAADLTKMQVVAALDESDVGRIRPKQVVTFRVDAYPNDTFRGTVSQVRLEPKVQQNVVTYSTVIDVPNDDLRLKPGMTANVNVEISHASNVLRVPNAALRFRPSNDVFAALGQTPPEPQGRGAGGRRGGNAPGGAAGAPNSSATAPAAPGSSAAPPSPPQAGGNTAAAPGRQAGGRGNASAPAQGPGGATAGGAEGSNPPAGDASNADRRARFAERLQNMSPQEREAALARMRERGFDPTAAGAPSGGRGAGSGASGGNAAQAARGGQQAAAAGGRRGGAPAQPDAPTTIDALFAPLPRTESFGRAWVFVDNQLRSLRLRLGATDGQNTELIEGDLKEGSEVVTNVVIAGQTTRPATTAFPGFGGPGGRGFPGGGGFGGAGRGGR
jgi:multidrug efflux pump subunit AcrA (membrane-fusion protein)